MSKTVFIDTMVFLHYRFIDEIDLPKILDAKSVTIVISRITLRELDKHKNSHNSPKIRDRASRILKNMEDWIVNKKPVRPGLVIQNYRKKPLSDYFQRYDLEKEWNDDQLIASILQFKEDNPREDIILITQDTGPRLTAHRLNIPVICLSEEYKLPVELDPNELEIRKLKEKLAKIEGAQPKLVLYFSGSNKEDNFKRFVIHPSVESEEDQIKPIIFDLKEKHPKIHPPKREGKRINALDEIGVVASLDKIPLKEYERYNKDLDTFFIKYENFLIKKWEVMNRRRCSILLDFEVENIGNAPADDVDLYIHFPDGFKLFTIENRTNLPKEPRPPQKPRTSKLLFLPELPLVESFINLNGISDIEMPPSYKLKKANSYEFTDTFVRIKHGDYVKLPELFLVFDSFEAAKSFSCDYTFSVANLIEPIKGKLNFVIEKST